MRFDTWFNGQFGKRPSKKSINDLARVRDEKRWAYNDAQHIYDVTWEWEQRRTAALYAWQAMNGKK